MIHTQKIAVIGAGAWGTALALTAHRAGNNVLLVTRKKEHVEQIKSSGENQSYLSGFNIPNEIEISCDPNTIKTADLILWVTPTQRISEVANNYKSYITSHIPIVMCCKGFDLSATGINALPSFVISKILPNPIAVLSGPNLAKEVAKNLPTASSIACKDNILAEKIGKILHHPMFRLYLTNDIIGTQVAGALKNVIAIASGICIGQNFGENARAALITRGIAEIKRIGIHLGGDIETFLGMSGVGDLFLTASSHLSRNTKFGIALGEGKTIEQATEAAGGIVEGYFTTKAAHALTQSSEIHAYITKSVYKVLFENQSIDEAVKEILNTHAKWEHI